MKNTFAEERPSDYANKSNKSFLSSGPLSDECKTDL